MTPQINCLGKTIPVLRVSTHIYGGFFVKIDRKMFIFRVNLGMWPLKLIVLEKWALFWWFQHTFLGFLEEIDGKMFIFRVNLGMWPLKSINFSKNEHCSEGSNTHLWCFQGHRWENIHFPTKPRHVTPQIDRLGKMSTVPMVSMHIYGVSQEIDGKMFIFRVNLGMWPIKLIILEKWALFWGFQHTFMVFPRT